jgi:hypothetical protein
VFWETLIRAFIGIVCIISLVIMTDSFIKYRQHWNTKTLDYWYARVMWTVGGLSACIEGIIRQLPMRYSFVFVVAAALTTLKGNLRKGRWGGIRE